MAETALLEILSDEYACICGNVQPATLDDGDVEELDDDRSDIVEIKLTICSVQCWISAGISQPLVNLLALGREKRFERGLAVGIHRHLFLEKHGGTLRA